MATPSRPSPEERILREDMRDVRRAQDRTDALIDRVDAKIDALTLGMNERLDSINRRLDTLIDALAGRISDVDRHPG